MTGITEGENLELEAQKQLIEIVKELGFMSYRFMITLNSGAFIVLLTFLGNSSASTAFSINLQAMKCAMLSFLGAIVGTFISIALTYISSQLHVVGRSLPFGKGHCGHLIWMVLPMAVSFGLFLAGGISAISGITVK
jgi:hypothetical protein